MDLNRVVALRDIHFLNKYEPNEVQYAKYAESNPSLIATGHKVTDTYQMLCKARGMLHYSCSDNWGDISGSDKISVTFTVSQMIISAVLEYAICFDLGWQIIWAYFQPASLAYLLKGGYQELEKHTSSVSVHEQLNCTIALHGVDRDLAADIKKLLTEVENQKVVIDLRCLYNEIKHRSSIHIQDCGDNDSNLCYSVNGKTIPKLCRNSYSNDELFSLLIDYDTVFSNYLCALVALLIPTEYLDNKMDYKDFINSAIHLASQINK